MTDTIKRAVFILIAEDNRLDAMLIAKALHEVKDWAIQTATVDDGQKAIAYLTQSGEFQAAEKPQLVILDLNLPKCEGTEILRFIRKTQTLCDLKVFILSSSPRDAVEARIRDAQVEADGYFTKPFDVDEFLELGAVIRGLYERG